MNTMDWTQVDDAIREGRSSIDIWTRMGRQFGVSLEMIVVRRRSLKKAVRRKRHSANVLPLFASVVNAPLVANG